MLISMFGRHQRRHCPLEGGGRGVEDFRSLENTPLVQLSLDELHDNLKAFFLPLIAGCHRPLSV